MSGYNGDLDPLDRLGHHWDHLLEVDTQESMSTEVVSARQTRKISCSTCHGWKVRCVGITATNATCDTCSRVGRTCQPYVTKHPGSVISACLSCRKSKIKCKEGETGGACKTCFLHKQMCSYVETRSGFEAKKPRKYKKRRPKFEQDDDTIPHSHDAQSISVPSTSAVPSFHNLKSKQANDTISHSHDAQSISVPPTSAVPSFYDTWRQSPPNWGYGEPQELSFGTPPGQSLLSTRNSQATGNQSQVPMFEADISFPRAQ